LEAKPQKRQRTRRILTPILVALSILVFTITVPAAWGARTVLNTDRYVATVAPLADDPAVQASIATKLTDQVFSALNVQETLSDALGALGDRATVLAGPLTIAVKGFVRDQVEKVVASDAFKTFWVEANRFVHTQGLAILRAAPPTTPPWVRARPCPPTWSGGTGRFRRSRRWTSRARRSPNSSRRWGSISPTPTVRSSSTTRRTSRRGRRPSTCSTGCWSSCWS